MINTFIGRKSRSKFCYSQKSKESGASGGTGRGAGGQGEEEGERQKGGREVRDQSFGFLINSAWPSLSLFWNPPPHHYQPRPYICSLLLLFVRTNILQRTGLYLQQDSHTASMREFKSKAFWRAVLAEFVGMTLFIFLSISTAIGNKNNSNPDQELKVSLAFGLAIATLAQSLGHISGAHLNPAVTLGMLVSCQISLFKAFMYIVAQMLGSALASGIVYGTRPSTTDALGLNAVSDTFHIMVVDRNIQMWEVKMKKWEVLKEI